MAWAAAPVAKAAVKPATASMPTRRWVARRVREWVGSMMCRSLSSSVQAMANECDREVRGCGRF